MFRFCVGHKKPLQDAANSMNGSIVACFYLDHILNAAAVSYTLSCPQDGDNPRPKKKKKLMKKTTKRRGEELKYTTVQTHFLKTNQGQLT